VQLAETAAKRSDICLPEFLYAGLGLRPGVVARDQVGAATLLLREFCGARGMIGLATLQCTSFWSVLRPACLFRERNYA
jgi:hypothetical protein